jgi:hypothetical protein
MRLAREGFWSIACTLVEAQNGTKTVLAWISSSLFLISRAASRRGRERASNSAPWSRASRATHQSTERRGVDSHVGHREAKPVPIGIAKVQFPIAPCLVSRLQVNDHALSEQALADLVDIAHDRNRDAALGPFGAR